MAEDPHLGITANGYELVKRIDTGRIGTVYKAVRGRDTVACKVITEGRLKDGWEEEINKNVLLRGIPGVVPYHTFGSTHDKQSRPFTFVIFDFIDGWNLRDYAKSNREQINLAFIEGLLRTILTVLHACQAVGFLHGDLHEGNILIKKPDVRLPGSPLTIWISDFGYGGSLNNVQPKNDLRQTAAIVSTLLRSLDPTSLTARDRLAREKLMTFATKDLLEVDAMQGPHVNSRSELLRMLTLILRQAEAEAAAALSNTHSQDPADYLSAEAFGNRREDWVQMFVPDFLAAEELLSRNITILTGARGCGKTMAFRRLTKFMDEMIGQPSGVRGSDQFAGFYMNCRDLAEAFPWLPRHLSPIAEQQILHFFHLNWMSEILRTLAVTTDGGSAASNHWLWSFLSKYFPDHVQPIEGVNPLNFARAFVENQKERCRQAPLSRAAQHKWTLATMDFLDSLQSELEANVSWAKNRPLYFFLDDYTIPLLPRTVQRVLNRVIFRRRDKIFFKVSTEASNSFDLTGLRNKPLELQQDFQLIDLATASLHQPLPEKLRLLGRVFLPRIDRHPHFKGKAITLELLLGTARFNNSAIARQMRSAAQSKGKQAVLYYGTEAFAGLWTSDFRTIIQVFVDMLRESSDPLVFSSTGPAIAPKIQDKIVRAKGGEFVIFSESLTNPDQWDARVSERRKLDDYGRHLREIVEAFIAVSRWELTQGELVHNQDTVNPKQAFRLEILDRFEVPARLMPYYAGLVRWHLFLQDWRGKSARGMLTPRLFLNRILIPYANLTFSTHDNIGLTNQELLMLLEFPKTFPRYWENKQKQRRALRNRRPLNQSVMDFGKRHPEES